MIVGGGAEVKRPQTWLDRSGWCLQYRAAPLSGLALPTCLPPLHCARASAPVLCSAGAPSRAFFWKLPHGIDTGSRSSLFYQVLVLQLPAESAQCDGCPLHSPGVLSAPPTLDGMHCNLSMARWASVAADATLARTHCAAFTQPDSGTKIRRGCANDSAPDCRHHRRRLPSAGCGLPHQRARGRGKPQKATLRSAQTTSRMSRKQPRR